MYRTLSVVDGGECRAREAQVGCSGHHVTRSVFGSALVRANVFNPRGVDDQGTVVQDLHPIVLVCRHFVAAQCFVSVIRRLGIKHDTYEVIELFS